MNHDVCLRSQDITRGRGGEGGNQGEREEGDNMGRGEKVGIREEGRE